MLLAGEVSPSLLEDVLSDLAARCAIRAVQALDGTDLLTPAVDAALAVLKGDIKSQRSLPPNARPSAPAPPAVLPTRAPTVAARQAAPSPPPVAARQAAPSPAPPPTYLSLTTSDPPPPRRVQDALPSGLLARGQSRDDDDAPSSLEDAVMRELSDRSPHPGTAREPDVDPPPIIEPSELRPRSSNPPPPNEIDEDSWDEPATLPSIPPDAIVPEMTSSGEHAAAASQFAFDTVPMTRPLPMPVDSIIPRPRELEVDADPEIVEDERGGTTLADDGLYLSAFAPSAQRPARSSAPPARVSDSPAGEEPSISAPPMTSSRGRLVFVLIAFAVLGVAISAALRMSGGDAREPASPAPSTEPPPSASPASVMTVTASAVTGAAAVPSAAVTGAAAVPSTSSPQPDDVPPGAEVPSGYGLIEIAAPPGARVRVDGAVVGTGPLATSIALPGYHEVRVDHLGRDAKHVVEVRVGKTTRVRSAAPP